MVERKEEMGYMKQLIKTLVKAGMLLIYHLFIVLVRVKKDIIVFESSIGRNYSGNPRAIYEEIVRQGFDKKYRCYYIFEDTSTKIPGLAIKIKKNRLRYFYIMAVAGVWVSDSRFQTFIKKRKGVTYIQTWHGTPLKKLALDMDDVSMSGETDIETYKKNFYDNAQTWDYLISQNSYSSEIFRSCFAFQKSMLEVGYPRNDVLLNSDHTYINTLKKQLGLPMDKKIILYAPTWRDDEFYENGKYKFNPKLDFELIRQSLGDEYIMLVKYHYLVMERINWEEFRGFIYEFDLSYEISQLYLVADLLITDYSSVMFDYSLLKRPMLFYAYDLGKYKNNLRGFYFDFEEEAPGPIALTTKELIQDIIDYDIEKYKDKYDRFSKKYNLVDDGNASKKVVEVIVKHIQGE